MLILELFDNCKYGRYFCSTDKKWKCRKSPKKSRMDETILNPHDQIEDFYAKMRVLQDLELNPQVDQKVVQQRKLDLKREFERLNENLRDWFGKGKEGGAGGGGWDRYNTKGERIGKCGDKKPGEGKPKCLSKSAAAKLRAKGGKKAIAQAVRRKRREDPNPERKGKAQHVKSLSEGDIVKFPANITRAKELAQQVLYAMIDGDMEKNKKYRIVQRNRQELKKLGYDYTWSKQGPTLVYKPTNLSLPIKLPENFADGKVKGKSRPGRVKQAGASCKGSVTDLRAKAKKYPGEKGKMYHWCANMKAGKK